LGPKGSLETDRRGLVRLGTARRQAFRSARLLAISLGFILFNTNTRRAWSFFGGARLAACPPRFRLPPDRSRLSKDAGRPYWPRLPLLGTATHSFRQGAPRVLQVAAPGPGFFKPAGNYICQWRSALSRLSRELHSTRRHFWIRARCLRYRRRSQSKGSNSVCSFRMNLGRGGSALKPDRMIQVPFRRRAHECARPGANPLTQG